MPLFTPLNNININNSNQAVKELNIHDVNNREFNTIKDAIAALTKPLGSIPKEYSF